MTFGTHLHSSIVKNAEFNQWAQNILSTKRKESKHYKVKLVDHNMQINTVLIKCINIERG